MPDLTAKTKYKRPPLAACSTSYSFGSDYPGKSDMISGIAILFPLLSPCFSCLVHFFPCQASYLSLVESPATLWHSPHDTKPSFAHPPSSRRSILSGTVTLQTILLGSTSRTVIPNKLGVSDGRGRSYRSIFCSSKTALQ